MKKAILLILLLLFPLQVYAYSDKLIVSGNPIGIEIHSNGVYVIDSDQKNSSFQKGDRIIAINNEKVNSIEELNRSIQEEGIYQATIIRKEKTKNIELKAVKENDTITTGLYVKDEVDGIGTLSYIDPETKIYASLGHEILESSSNQLFDLKNGYIYDVEVNYINKSENGNIGEVHATFNNTVLGTIKENKYNGIYGKYTDNLEQEELVEVAKKEEIKKGKAYVRMQMNQEQKDYEINILSIDEKSEVKNIYFEITDENLIKKTGGVVQGMSGSPIIQNNKIIGVVNYVIVNDSKKGYGIFIEKMLEEGDKLLQQ